MHPLSYASAIPPHIRVGRFVADEPRLGWTFKLLRQRPKAEVYIVGGTARDAVRGVMPKGIHLVVRNIPLDDLVEILRKMGSTETEDDAFISFRPDGYRDDDPIEVTTPRDHIPEPSAPIIFDLSNRDFTMNAMAYSLNSGLLIDPFGGVDDLRNHVLRAVGKPSKRFLERPRRTLRALRLASEHKYRIDDGTWNALKDHLPRLQRIVTAEDGSAVFETPRAHVGHEFLRTLGGHPTYGFRLWRESGAADLFTPELTKLEHIKHHRGDTALTRSERVLEEIGHPMPTLVFAALVAHLEDMALNAARDLIVRLHLHAAHPHFNYQDALWMLEHRNVLDEAEPEHMPPSAFENIFGKQRGEHLLTFLHALHRGSGQHSVTRERLHQATARRRQLVTDIQKPQLLRGRDLETLGITPGPHYRKILSKIRDAQLDGHINDREEAMNYARNLLATQTFSTTC